MNKIEFISPDVVTDHRTISDGMITGTFRTVVYAPNIQNRFAKDLVINVQHFIDEEVEAEDEPGSGNMITVKRPYLLNSEALTYKSEEFDAICIDNNISLDTAEFGPFGVLEKIFPIIAEMLVKSGGSKNKGTLGTFNWIVKPENY